MTPTTIAGPTNSLLDVGGLQVGQTTLREPGWLTGTSVVLAPDAGAVAGVDVRGGGPGTRETDALDPRNLVERVHAVVLTGGSAFGLATADGVMNRLYAAGRGYPMGAPGDVVPIVPAAVVFDLGRGGVFGNRPGAVHGEAAYDDALVSTSVLQGVVGGGTGATAGGFKGGVGTASQVLRDGGIVAAYVVANPLGSVVHPVTGELYAAPFLLPGDLPPGVVGLRPPAPAEVESSGAFAQALVTGSPFPPGLATTIAVVATDLTLTKSQCQKVAGVAQDGYARAIRPVHSMFDGDTVFALATGTSASPDPVTLHELLAAAADVVTRAIGRAVLHAESVTTPGGSWRAYAQALPSALVRA